MARRIATVTIEGIRSEESGCRDNGKTFVITEMSALEGERWSSTLLRLILASGIELPEDVEPTDGAAGVASTVKAIQLAPLLSVLQHPELDPQVWACIRYQHAPGHPPQVIAQGENCQIEEISTITRLRVEVLKLHTAFFSKEKASPTLSASPSPATPTGLQPTRISRPRSGPLSRPAMRPSGN